MNDVIKCILERRSIRKYNNEQINDSELEQILNAGLYAANAGSRQSSFIIACQNSKINKVLGRNKANAFRGTYSTNEAFVSKEQPSIADDPNIRDAFYGAPTVLTLFSPKNFLYGSYDCGCMAENIMLAANSLGIGSCLIGSAWDSYNCELGQKLLKEWQIPTNHHADIHVILGYPLDEIATVAKPRKEKRIMIIK